MAKRRLRPRQAQGMLGPQGMDRCNNVKVPATDGAVRETRPDGTDCDARLRGLALIPEAT